VILVGPLGGLPLSASASDQATPTPFRKAVRACHSALVQPDDRYPIKGQIPLPVAFTTNNGILISPVVGLTGFEPATSCTPSKCASQAALQPDRKRSPFQERVAFGEVGW
jgi:hypothetical protein